VESVAKIQSGSGSRRTDVEEAELCQTDVSGTVRKEFQSAEFGDERLTDRLMQVGDRLGRAPAESIPNACEDWASTKATYRFCDNERVDPDEILSTHKGEQRSRVRDKEELLVISNTTELVSPRHPSKKGLGDIGNSTTDLEGVKVHSTIGLDPQTHRMTGVIDQQPRIICLDFVDIHYYGCPHADAAELYHTKPRDGTSQCHRYLAGFVLCRAKPLVVAVTAVRGDESTSDAVERLLDHIAALPFDIAGLLADRGFYDGTSIDRLDATAPVALPIVRGGEQMAKKLDATVSYWSEYVMYEGSEQERRFPLAVCVSYQQGNRGKHGLLVRAYVACDLTDRTPKEVEALYQKRSAIETAFRTMGTTDSERERRLFAFHSLVDRPEVHPEVGGTCLSLRLAGDMPRSGDILRAVGRGIAPVQHITGGDLETSWPNQGAGWVASSGRHW